MASHATALNIDLFLLEQEANIVCYILFKAASRSFYCISLRQLVFCWALGHRTVTLTLKLQIA